MIDDLSSPLLLCLRFEPNDATAAAAGLSTGSLLGSAACLAGATFAAFATASLMLYSPTKLARQLEGEHRAPAAIDLGAHERDYRALCWCLLVAGLSAAVLLAWHGAGPWRVPALAGLTLLGGLSCGVVPAKIAEARAERVVLWTTRRLRPLRILAYYPLILPLETLGCWTLRILRIPESRATDPDEIAEEILAAVSDYAKDIALTAEETSWIENIVELKDRQASEIMTPRTDMVAFAASMPLLAAIHAATSAGYSRFPVYEDTVDNVVGVFYVKDALSLLGEQDDHAAGTLRDRIRQPIFVPKSIGLVDLLRQFRGSQVQLAVVLDEYGGTAGLVSIEDVLEEIVGEISDEFDVGHEEPIRVIEAGRVIEATGRARVDEVNDNLGVDIPEGDDYDTVAGFVLSELDRIPRVDEKVCVDGVEIRILGADDRRINRMRLTLLQPETTDEGDPGPEGVAPPSGRARAPCRPWKA